MANLLAEILSFGNTARRKLGDLISDPAGVLQMQVDRIMPTQYEQRAEFDRMAGKQHNTAAAQSAQAKMDQLAQDAALNAITVYHGSPHKFDKFDMSKIGTGEGNQSYGHGLYFAESPDVAGFYQDKIKNSVEMNRVSRKIRELKKKVDDLEPLNNYGIYKTEEGKSAAEEIKQLIEYRNGVEKEPGALYKVDLPDEAVARFLDWDKPLSQQAPDVKQWIDNLFYNKELPKKWETVKGQRTLLDPAIEMVRAKNGSGDMTGSAAISMLKQYFDKGDAHVTDYLKSQGIPGIRYLDEKSRAIGTGTSNFVVFDDTLPTILERNGIPLSDLLQR